MTKSYTKKEIEELYLKAGSMKELAKMLGYKTIPPIRHILDKADINFRHKTGPKKRVSIKKHQAPPFAR